MKGCCVHFKFETFFVCINFFLNGGPSLSTVLYPWMSSPLPFSDVTRSHLWSCPDGVSEPMEGLWSRFWAFKPMEGLSAKIESHFQFASVTSDCICSSAACSPLHGCGLRTPQEWLEVLNANWKWLLVATGRMNWPQEDPVWLPGQQHHDPPPCSFQ